MGTLAAGFLFAVIGGILTVAGIGKIVSPKQTVLALRSATRFPSTTPVTMAVRIFAGIELAVGAASAIAPGQIATRLSLALLSGTIIAAGYMGLVSGSRVPCGCFGSISSSPLGFPNVVLGALMFLSATLVSVDHLILAQQLSECSVVALVLAVLTALIGRRRVAEKEEGWS